MNHAFVTLVFLVMGFGSAGCDRYTLLLDGDRLLGSIKQEFGGKVIEATIYFDEEEGELRGRTRYKMVFGEDGYAKDFYVACTTQMSGICRAPSQQWPRTIRPSSARIGQVEGSAMAEEIRLSIEAAASGIKCLFLGNSIFASLGRNPNTGLPVWEERFEPKGCFNAALGGERVENLLLRMTDGGGFLNENIPPEAIFLILIGANDNDLLQLPSSGMSEEEVAEEVGIQIALGNIVALARIRALRPWADVIFVESIPSRSHPARICIERYNGVLMSMEALENVWGVELYDLFLDPDGTLNAEAYCYDGVHPSRKGFNMLADALEVLLSYLLA